MNRHMYLVDLTAWQRDLVAAVMIFAVVCFFGLTIFGLAVWLRPGRIRMAAERLPERTPTQAMVEQTRRDTDAAFAELDEHLDDHYGPAPAFDGLTQAEIDAGTEPDFRAWEQSFRRPIIRFSVTRRRSGRGLPR